MKAAVFYGAKDFRVEDIEEPKIKPTDIILKVLFRSDLEAVALNQ